MTDRPEVLASPAYHALRASSRRLLLYVEREVARSGGPAVRLWNDQLGVVGSRQISLPGLLELHALGLLEVARFSKCHVCSLSEAWRDIRSTQEAMAASAAAREQRKLPVLPAMAEHEYQERRQA
jgi:hypothetical protein